MYGQPTVYDGMGVDAGLAVAPVTAGLAFLESPSLPTDYATHALD